MKKIKILAVDVDGCITPGEGEPADIDVLKKLAQYNSHADADDNIPRITLCTGRQQPFVDLMCQMIKCKTPAIFENGAGIYDPVPYEFHFHPSITPEARESLHRYKLMIERKMCAKGQAKLQPGKEISLSVYPAKGYTVEDNEKRLRALMQEGEFDFFLDVSIMCINVLFPGVDKGAGIKWLAELTGVSTDEIGAVGDAIGDLASIQAAGFGGCPANASDKIKRNATYVARQKNGHGVIEIVEEVILHNKRAQQ